MCVTHGRRGEGGTDPNVSLCIFTGAGFRGAHLFCFLDWWMSFVDSPAFCWGWQVVPTAPTLSQLPGLLLLFALKLALCMLITPLRGSFFLSLDCRNFWIPCVGNTEAEVLPQASLSISYLCSLAPGPGWVWGFSYTVAAPPPYTQGRLPLTWWARCPRLSGCSHGLLHRVCEPRSGGSPGLGHLPAFLSARVSSPHFVGCCHSPPVRLCTPF